MQYVTVFDASSDPLRNLNFVIPGLMLSLVGALLVFAPNALEKIGFKQMKRWRGFAWFYFSFAMLWTVGAGVVVVNDAISASRNSKAKNCDVVEGRVEKFHPMPRSGHDTERFEVNGVKFSYSDYIVTSGFNNTSSHGGPIHENLPVRICHRDGKILRLEIAS